MSKQSNFGFTNGIQDSLVTVALKQLDLVSNYAISTETANQALLNNKTAPIDVQEVISFRSDIIENLKSNAVNIQYPSPVKQGIQYSVQVTDTLSTTDTSDASFRIDEPITCTISFRHPRSGNIDATKVATVFIRAASALYNFTDDGWRFDDLMRGAERPAKN